MVRDRDLRQLPSGFLNKGLDLRLRSYRRSAKSKPYWLGGIVSLIAIVNMLPEGWFSVWDHGNRTNKWQLIEWDWSQNYNFWSGIFGGIVLSMGTHGTDQMMVQRYLSARSRRDAALALIASGFVVWVQFALFIIIGIGLASYYESYGAATTMPEKPDRVFAHFIVHVFPANTGLVGLMLAAIFAASMSTLSSSLSASASAVMHDFVLPMTEQSKPWTPKRLLVFTQGLTLLFGIIQMLIGIQAQHFSASVIDNSLKIAGFSGGLLLGLFLLGITTKRVGQPAALFGASLAGVVLLACEFSGLLEKPLGVPWLALIGAVVTMTGGCVTQAMLPVRVNSAR